jgi:putative ABC transport system permease protein
VGRRTTEIAALKTFGLKGGQVAALFLSEAFLLGLIGSAVGCLIGVGLSGLVNQYGEAFLQQRLTWRLYPEAIAYGMGLGLIVTLVFGVLPILTANRVRPAAILRPNETVIPAAGCLHSAIALLLVVVVIGGVAGGILGSVIVGMIGVALTLLILGVLIGVLWVLVWLVGKLPAFGSVDLRLALRSLTARRIRTATTLLALSAGMFALSSISFVGAGTRELLQFQITQNLGGNVLVFPVLSLISQGVGQGLLNLQLQNLDGIEATTVVTLADAQLQSIDGRPVTFNFPFDPPTGRPPRQFQRVQLQVRETSGAPTPLNLIEGRDLQPEDRGRRVLVVTEDFTLPFATIAPDGSLGPAVVRVGSEVTLIGRNGRPETFTVIGIARSNTRFNFGSGYVPPEALPTNSGFSFTVLRVRPEQLNSVLLALSANPLVIALDLQFIDGLLSRLIDQFAALPTLVGLLSLLAAAVTMANTVSLATLERRRQIGILKAIGLKSRRVLGVMLIENTVIGLLGGLLGIGLSALGVAIMTALGQGEAIPIPRDSAPVAIALVIAAVIIAWVATFLSARPVVQENVINVLRYE